MTDAIRHRGPDDDGYWHDPNEGIGLGHRRLSIIDLSPEGRQPMTSASGRFVLAFNGEVYNFPELRASLEARGATFRGRSDTEVVLAAIEAWGIPAAVERFSGMFAFALWDRLERKLHLVRDRIGEKPLYYGWQRGTLLFGSELKALRAHPAWHSDISRDALALYFRHNYIPAPYSIYAGVSKAIPGAIHTFSAEHPDCEPDKTVYWCARQIARAGLTNPVDGTDAEMIDACDLALREVVRREMVSDVPLGAFLSGGIDSSVVVSLMQTQSTRPVRTFTIGFHESAFNEAEYARAVATHLGTDHTELYVSSADALNVIPQLPHIYDEPFADSSQIPTILISQLTRNHVTVSLSGDGGDELFGGYGRYALADRIWKGIRWMPRALRGVASRAVTSIPADGWDRALGTLRTVLPPSRAIAASGDRAHKLAALFAAPTRQALYRHMVSHWPDPERLVSGARPVGTVLSSPEHWLPEESFAAEMMYLDTVSYLPGDILVKVDRASMAVGLESRAPFLDHSIVELAWRLPMRLRLGPDGTKQVLRRVLQRYIPAALIDRPKMGFGVPLGAWLKGTLRDWAEDLLDQHRLAEQGFLDVTQIAECWRQHQDGTRNWQSSLWDVLMFQAWLAEQ